MSLPALALRTAESVPGVVRLMAIAEELTVLRAEHQHLAALVRGDVDFMDVPTIRVRHLERGEQDVTVGMVFHVNAFESEHTGHAQMFVHAASGCAPRNRYVDDCRAPVGARVKRKYTRVGRRYWNTFLGDHVLVATPQGDDEYFTLAPLAGARS